MSVNNSPTGQHGVQQKDGGPIFVMQSMSAGTHGPNHLHERYMSNESLENDRNSTTSSTESPNSSGIQQRKDHEFIPTRSSSITASRPAAPPNQFTKIPSNPLLISAQKQLMQAEEIRKRKESEKMVRRGDDEPDWQGELGAWKTRRRKQSEDAFQRVAEIKNLEDCETGEPRKLGIGKKLSSLLYTNPEDDWSDFGLEKEEYEDTPDQSSSTHTSSHALSPTEQKMLLQKNNSNKLMSQYSASVSPSTINEYEEEYDQVTNENNTHDSFNNTPTTQFDLGHKVQNWTQVIQNDAPKRTLSSPMVTYTQKEADNSIGSANGENAPQVRRKSSELSASMKNRLEAFNTSAQPSGIPEYERAEPQKTSVEPDKTFHNKLLAFRKISEGQLNQTEAERKPKPPMTISSLLGGGTNASRTDNNMINNTGVNGDRNNEEYENDTLDDVDQLLDDALEESYRSVLETDQSSHSSMSNPSSMVNPGNDKKPHNGGGSNLVFSDNDFVGHQTTKAPPSEKPPPVPPLFDGTSSNIDEEIDKQEQAIIASLEMEEREHKRYMETQEKMRRMPTPSGSSENKKLSGQLAQMSNSMSSNDKTITSSTSQSASKKFSDTKPHTVNNGSSGTNVHPGVINGNKYNAQQQKQADQQQQIQAKKRSQQQEQKSYNQHWLIQEAEQRRLAGGSTKPHVVSPSIAQHNTMNVNPPPQQQQPQNNGLHSNMMMTSPVSHGGEIPTLTNNIRGNSPVYENSSYVNHQQHNHQQNNMYTNHQRIDPSTNDNNWQQHTGVQSVGYSQSPPNNTNINHQYPIQNENVYANLGTQPPLGPNSHHQDNSSLNYERDGLIPGPQVPPRNAQDTSPGSNGDRVLSVSGKKRCSHCKEELGRGAAMIIESLRLFYHLRCFQCCVCQVQLGNGASGTDVRVRNNKLHCQNCYSNDEGLKFSKV